MQNKWMSLVLAALTIFNVPAFAELPQLNSALENYIENRRDERALNQVRKAVQDMDKQGIHSNLSPVLSLTDAQLKKRVDHYIQLADAGAPQANAASLRKIGACLVIAATVTLAQGCYLTATQPKMGSGGYAIQSPGVVSDVAVAGQ